MTEDWLEIPEFPMYAVSSEGRVQNLVTEQMKVATVNQQGIPSVLLMKDGRQHRRSVAVLVAEAFLEPHPRPEVFNSLINLNTDRLDNRVLNLAWRPRWFAVKYHAQFKDDSRYGWSTDGQPSPITNVETGEVFDSIRDCAKHYGLLERDLVLCTQNRTPVFPVWQEFCFV